MCKKHVKEFISIFRRKQRLLELKPGETIPERCCWQRESPQRCITNSSFGHFQTPYLVKTRNTHIYIEGLPPMPPTPKQKRQQSLMRTTSMKTNSKTQAVALDAKSPKHHLDTSRKRPKPDPKNSFTLPLESTKNNLLGHKSTCPAYETIVNSSTGIAPKAFRTLALEYNYKSLNSSKVRAPGMQNTSHKNSFTLRFESTKNNLLGLVKSGLGTPLPKASNRKTQAVALDAKSPKHHLDTSRKRPKPDPKNSFTLPLESTKNNLLGRKGTRPAYQTIVNSSTGIAPKAFRTLALEYTYKSLNSSKVRAPGMQNTSHKNSFTLRFESTKNNLLGLAKSGLGTPLPKASNSKTQAVALDAKSPKHHLDTSRKRPKPDPKNSFTLRLEATKNNLLGLAKSGLGTPLPKASNSKTQAVALDAKSPKHHVDTSRKRPKPQSKKLFHVTFGIHQKQSFGPQGHTPSLWNHRQFLHWNLVLEYTSESLEQQQDSCSRYAKHKPEKLFHVTFRIQKNSFGPQEHMPSL